MVRVTTIKLNTESSSLNLLSYQTFSCLVCVTGQSRPLSPACFLAALLTCTEAEWGGEQRRGALYLQLLEDCLPYRRLRSISISEFKRVLSST